MNLTRQAPLFLAACTLFGLAGFHSPAAPQDPPKPAPAPAPAPQDPPKTPPQDPPKEPPKDPPKEPGTGPEEHRMRDGKASLRISGIPDADKEKLAKQYGAVTQWLSKQIERPVEFVPVNDYAAAVAGLAANKLDMVWLGGVTAVQAEEVTKNRCQPIVARDEDLKFKSYWIANKKLVDAGTFQAVAERKPMPLEALAAMKPAFAKLSFTFGPKTSTSGHIMPRYYLERPEVGLDPEKCFKAKPGYALTGGHSTVLANVASGAFDVGVLNYISWEQAKDEQKAAAPVIFVSPEYTDYCMVIHYRVGPVFPLRVIKAFLTLDPKIEEHKAVLDVFGTQKFVKVGPAHLDNIRTIVKAAKERGILE